MFKTHEYYSRYKLEISFELKMNLYTIMFRIKKTSSHKSIFSYILRSFLLLVSFHILVFYNFHLINSDFFVYEKILSLSFRRRKKKRIYSLNLFTWHFVILLILLLNEKWREIMVAI